MSGCTGITLDLDKSLHNQGVVEQEKVTLGLHAPERGAESPAKTEGATTHNESMTNSDVRGRGLGMVKLALFYCFFPFFPMFRTGRGHQTTFNGPRCARYVYMHAVSMSTCMYM